MRDHGRTRPVRVRVALEVLHEGASYFLLGPALRRIGDALSEAHRPGLGLKLGRHGCLSCCSLSLLAVSPARSGAAAGAERWLACNCGSRPTAELLRELILVRTIRSPPASREAGPPHVRRKGGIRASDAVPCLPEASETEISIDAGPRSKTGLRRAARLNQIIGAQGALSVDNRLPEDSYSA
jgi:hypothetical protein